MTPISSYFVRVPALRTVRGSDPGAGGLCRRDVDLELLGAPDHRHRRWRADPVFGEQTMKLVDTCNLVAVKRDDDVAFAQLALRRRTVRLDRRHQDAGFDGQSVEAD